MKLHPLSARVAIALAGLATGFLMAAALPRSGKSGGGITKTMPAEGAATVPDRGPKHHEANSGPGISFAGLKALLSEDGGVIEARPAVERMTTGELRTLLSVAEFPKMGLHLSGEAELRDGMVVAAAEELYRREGSEAVNWADASGHKEAAFALLRVFAVKDPIAADQHLGTYALGYWDPQLMTSLVNLLGEGAMKHGAAEALQLEGKWQGAGLFKYASEITSDFNFREYFSKAADERSDGLRTALAVWTASDPDGSGAYLREKLASSRSDFMMSPKTAFGGRAAMVGEEEAAKWFCGLLPAGREKEAGWVLADLAGPECTAGRANAILQNLESDEGKAQFTASLIDSGTLRPDAVPVAVSAIRALGSEASQTEMLIRCARDCAPQAAMGSRFASQLEEVMSQVGLPEEQQAKVKAALPKSP